MFILFSFVDYVNLLFGVALLWQNKYLCLSRYWVGHLAYCRYMPPMLRVRGGVLEDILGLEGQVLDLRLEASSPQKLPCPRYFLNG